MLVTRLNRSGRVHGIAPRSAVTRGFGAMTFAPIATRRHARNGLVTGTLSLFGVWPAEATAKNSKTIKKRTSGTGINRSGARRAFGTRGGGRHGGRVSVALMRQAV